MNKNMLLAASLMFSVATTALPSMLDVIYAEYEANVLNIDRVDEYLVTLKESTNWLEKNKSNYEGMYKNGLTAFIGKTIAGCAGAVSGFCAINCIVDQSRFYKHSWHKHMSDLKIVTECANDCKNLVSQETYEQLPKMYRCFSAAAFLCSFGYIYIRVQEQRANSDYWRNLQIEKNKAIIAKLEQLKEGI